MSAAAPTLTLDVRELVLRVAAGAVGAGEHPPNSNAGPYVERVQRSTGNRPPDPWCASWVSLIGRTALGRSWPVPNTAGVMVIADWAKRVGCRYLVTGSGQGVPKAGDLYLLWNARRNRWAHVGFIVRVVDPAANPLRVLVRDGNTTWAGAANPELDRDGWLVAEKMRTLTANDRLVRWVERYAAVPPP